MLASLKNIFNRFLIIPDEIDIISDELDIILTQMNKNGETNNEDYLKIMMVGRIYEEEEVFKVILKVVYSFIQKCKAVFYFTDGRVLSKIKNILPTIHCLEFVGQEHHKLIDYIVTIGGDGTILYAAKQFLQKCPPLITFHRGSLGFMCRFQLTQIEDVVRDIVRYQKSKEENNQLPFEKSEIMRLKVRRISTKKGVQEIQEKVCINEVSISRKSYERVTLQIFINDELITHTAGDGMLISTPTGSTAYSLSAGGPIMQNGVNSILLVPIAPNSLSFRPICLPSDATIKIKLHKASRSEGYLSFDGQTISQFNYDDVIVISKSDHPLIFYQPKKSHDMMPTWINRLKFFLGWNQKFKTPALSACMKTQEEKNLIEKLGNVQI